MTALEEMERDRRVERVGFVASPAPEAQEGLRALQARYGTADLDEADVIVALGGDGFMLETMHRFLTRNVPIYGMNRGTVGFLMNAYEEDGLIDRLERAQLTHLHPLRMTTTGEDGARLEALAINEVSLLRQSRQAAKIRVLIDGVVRQQELFCDGVLVATPAGSTAYNLSAHGPIIPLGAEILALTPISAFRPRRWRGAILPAAAHVRFEIVEHWKRPVSATADYTEVRNVLDVEVVEDRGISIRVLFDAEHNLEERILKEQFLE